MHQNTRAAIAEGRRLWVERMREAKARGEIDRFPGGRRARGLPPLSRDPTIRRSQRLIEKMMAKRAIGLPANSLPSRSKGEKLSAAADLGLDIARQILELGVNPGDPKVLAIVQRTALEVIAQQIRVEQGLLPQNDTREMGEAVSQMTIEERARLKATLDEQQRLLDIARARAVAMKGAENG
jgi:hypothetical protein